MAKDPTLRTCDLNILKSILTHEGDSDNDARHTDFEVFPTGAATTEAEFPQVHVDEEGEGSKPSEEPEALDIEEHENKDVGKRKRIKKVSKPKPLKPKRDEQVRRQDRDRDGQSQSGTTDGGRRSCGESSQGSPRSLRHRSQNQSRKTKHPAKLQIVTNEERLATKYRELEELVSQDFLSRTGEICNEALREARQLLHNSLAVTRIVSGTVNEFDSGLRGRSQREITPRSHGSGLQRVQPEYSRGTREYAHDHESLSSYAASADHESNVVERTEHEVEEDLSQGQQRKHRRKKMIHTESEVPLSTDHPSSSTRTSSKLTAGTVVICPDPRQSGNERHSFPTAHPQAQRRGSLDREHKDDVRRPGSTTLIHTYGLDSPRGGDKREDGTSRRSDNRLGKTDNPFILRWLRRKNRLLRQQKRAKREEERLEKEIEDELEKVKEKRQYEARESFKHWYDVKTDKLRERRRSRSRTTSATREDADGAEPGYEEEEEEEKTGVQPRRHVHNYVFKRSISPRPKSTASFVASRNVKMKLTGKKKNLFTRDDLSHSHEPEKAKNDAEEAEKLRLSYDDWLSRKKDDFAEIRRKREAEREAEREANRIDSDLASVVPEMARKRIQEHRNRMRHVDSGVRRSSQGRPSTAGPSIERGETQDSDNEESGTKPGAVNRYSWREDEGQRRLSRPRTSKPQLRSTTTLTSSSSQENSQSRRVDRITDHHSNPYTTPDFSRPRTPDTPRATYVDTNGQFRTRPEPCGTEHPDEDVHAATPVVETTAYAPPVVETAEDEPSVVEATEDELFVVETTEDELFVAETAEERNTTPVSSEAKSTGAAVLEEDIVETFDDEEVSDKEEDIFVPRLNLKDVEAPEDDDNDKDTD